MSCYWCLSDSTPLTKYNIKRKGKRKREKRLHYIFIYFFLCESSAQLIIWILLFVHLLAHEFVRYFILLYIPIHNTVLCRIVIIPWNMNEIFFNFFLAFFVNLKSTIFCCCFCFLFYSMRFQQIRSDIFVFHGFFFSLNQNALVK